MISKQEVKENLYNSLKELGLTESEINLYITSIIIGPATIVTLAEHLDVPRPNVYKVIEGLEGHGLAKFSERQKYARTFVVESPTIVLDKLRKKRELVAGLDHRLVGNMPDLLAMYHQGETPTKIKVIQGREQYLKIFFSMLDETGDESQFFGSADDFIGFISWEEEKAWIRERVRRNIKIQALLLPGKDSHKLMQTDKQELRETRVLKDMDPFETSFQLFANKVLIWQPKAPLAVLIEDEYIVKMMRSIFHALWSNSGDTVK